MNTSTQVGERLRMWRERRRLTQLDLACEADISARHVSFLETGRSMPSREMILRLAERLDIPLRERNPLRHQIDATADPVLAELHAELQSYPLEGTASPDDYLDEYGGVLVPFKLRTAFGVLSFFGTTTVFGTPFDITLAELTIESFFPAEPATAELLAAAARSKRTQEQPAGYGPKP